MATPSQSFDLTVDRSDLSDARVTDTDAPSPGDGEAVLRVDRVGMTANNVTYAVLGDALRYWQFFPVAEPGRGRVPLWGFAEVVASRCEGVAEGDRVYGYLPSSGHLLVRPDRVRGGGFRDAAPHRADLPAVYNAYARADESRADLQVLFRPLFTTSFVLADWLADTETQAAAVVLSSASSKTAYGTAFLLRHLAGDGERPEVVGLTSPGNVAFTESLGVYDRVLSYDDVAALPTVPTAYLDVAGSAALRRNVHAHLGRDVVRDVVVGIAQGRAGEDPGPLEGARPSMFFAPDRIAQRQADWGPGGLEQRLGEAWEVFADRAQEWVDVVESSGPEGLRNAWLAVLEGVGPRTGHVVQL
jgi:hypothetical protein